MTKPALRDSMIQDIRSFYADLQRGSLPAVSLVKPGELDDGHPASWKYVLFEAFAQRIITELQAHPRLWQSTAIFITTTRRAATTIQATSSRWISLVTGRGSR